MRRIKLQWKWFDFWVGFYVDVPGKTLYICLLPTIVLRIYWGPWVTLSELADPADIDSPLDATEREHIEKGDMDRAVVHYAGRAEVSAAKATKEVTRYLEARIASLSKATEGVNGKTEA